jgi:flagellar biosynthesis/type III secretory pathway M-ring protein FliF/YscJ
LNIVADDEEDLGPSPAATLEKKIEQARDVAQQDPKIVANIIKDWTSSNAS